MANCQSLPNFHSSPDKYLEKRFSLTYRLGNWLSGRQFSKEISDLALNDTDFSKATNLSDFDVKSNARQWLLFDKFSFLSTSWLRKTVFTEL